MKNLSLTLLLLTLALATNTVFSQNYKQPFPSIDKQGKISDVKGKQIGWITSEGVIKDAAGRKIAHVDEQGNAVDATTGKILGKASKNGTYLYHVENGNSDSLTVSSPMNGKCEVKDKNGKTVLLVHESYKQYGACAIHCLGIKNEQKEMKMK